MKIKYIVMAKETVNLSEVDLAYHKEKLNIHLHKSILDTFCNSISHINRAIDLISYLK